MSSRILLQIVAVLFALVLAAGCKDLTDVGEGLPLPGKTHSPSPTDSQTSVPISATLNWQTGELTYGFYVYLGTDQFEVLNAGGHSPEFRCSTAGLSYDPPGDLAYDTTYYWRADSVNAAGVTRGACWQFTTLPPAPVADFTFSPPAGMPPLTVAFTDASTGMVGLWSWDFDNDGTVDSTAKNPTHIYTELDIYTVSLVVTGPGGSDTCVKSDCIVVTDELLVPLIFGTIQEAIDAAVEDDTVCVADGIYTGDGNKNLDFAGKTIHLKSENGPANCIIDCQNDGRGFYFNSGETAEAIAEGFTITNGSVPGSSGGAVACANASPTITGCIMTGNSGDWGGAFILYNSDAVVSDCTIATNQADYAAGIFCQGNSPTITDCHIYGNSSGEAGGGILCYESSATVRRCIITDNDTDAGGGIYWDGLPAGSLEDCVIADNYAQSFGGGLFLQNSATAIDNCIISGNSVFYHGGGLYALGYGIEMTHCVLTGNDANLGGALYCWTSNIRVVNCLLTDNSASQGGGVYLTNNSSPILANCTIAGNSSTWGGGMRIYDSTATIWDSIIWGNGASVEGKQFHLYDSGSEAILYYCSYADNSLDPDNVTGNGTLTEQEACIHSDPLFVSGPRGNYYLDQSGSNDCVDAGSDTAAFIGLDDRTTRVDGGLDTGDVDLGYHYVP